MCGYFCTGFIDFILKGKSLLDFTNLFSPNEYEKKDKIILNGIRCGSFSEINIEKNHLCRHDKNYYYFRKSNISVINLIVGSRNMIKVSENMSL